MQLQEILKVLPENSELRIRFLRQAHRYERYEVTEALLRELELRLKNGSHLYETDERREFDETIGDLIKQAEKAGDRDRATTLRFRQITSYSYAKDIESAAKSSGNPELIRKVIENYRAEYFNKAEMVINLLEHLGRKDEAKEYSLEAAKALRRTNGDYPASHIYLGLKMFKEAIEVKLENKSFDEAIKLAQEHFSEEELPQFYRRVFDAAEEKGYDNGFPVQVKAAKLLSDGELERATKKKYVDWIMGSTDKVGYLELIKEAGTLDQLRKAHERVVHFYQRGKWEWLSCGGRKKITLGAEDLAKAAAEAYQDLCDEKYAHIALRAFEEAGDLPKALFYARIVDPGRARTLEEVVVLLQD